MLCASGKWAARCLARHTRLSRGPSMEQRRRDQMSIRRTALRVTMLALAGGFLLAAPGVARADTCVVSPGVVQGPALITGTSGPDSIDCTGVTHAHTINGLG